MKLSRCDDKADNIDKKEHFDVNRERKFKFKVSR